MAYLFCAILSINSNTEDRQTHCFFTDLVRAHRLRLVCPGFFPPFAAVKTVKHPSSDVTALARVGLNLPQEFAHTFLLLLCRLLFIYMCIHSVMCVLWGQGVFSSVNKCSLDTGVLGLDLLVECIYQLG